MCEKRQNRKCKQIKMKNINEKVAGKTKAGGKRKEELLRERERVCAWVEMVSLYRSEVKMPSMRKGMEI